ncbi:hypothetical protein B0H14DRAFT_2563243 [Mycena olivaceomarginata]|nr:hypothetical protein B0H14DRAFT_2563243 [Mycena olivaceomarginata]
MGPKLKQPKEPSGRTVTYEAEPERYLDPQRRRRESGKLRLDTVLNSAAAKARRRQWDPPKITKATKQSDRCSTASPSPSALPSPSPPSPSLPPASVLGEASAETAFLTPAEHFALNVLAGMAQARDNVEPDMVSTTTIQFSAPVDPRDCADISLRWLYPSLAESLSHESSALGVQDEPIEHPTEQRYHWLSKPFPRYLAPETALQKRMRLELGKFGPLTPVQSAQFEAYRLGPHASSTWAHKRKTLRVKPKTGPLLSRSRWESICSWREGHQEYDTDWDEEPQQNLGVVGDVLD